MNNNELVSTVLYLSRLEIMSGSISYTRSISDFLRPHGMGFSTRDEYEVGIALSESR